MGQNALHLEEVNLAQKISILEEVIREFRQILPEECATAQAIDQGAPWEQIALKAIADGYIEFAEECNKFVEACLRRGA
ncbi:MAG: hypothetical protein WA373_12345 [Burkholderiales bacterium]